MKLSWPKKRLPDERLFTLLDGDALGDLSAASRDDNFEDILGGRPGAFESTRTFVGNSVGRRRLHLGLIVLVSIFVGLLLRVGHWQIVQGIYFAGLAEDNRTRTVITPANRGVITDRNGILLAWNEPRFRLLAVPSDIPADPNIAGKNVTDLANLLNLNLTDLTEIMGAMNKQEEVVLINNEITYEQALLFAAQASALSGFRLEVSSERAYLTTAIPTLSHVLGYTATLNPEEYEVKKTEGYRGFDDIGKQGIEAEYEQELRGIFGKEVHEVDAQGHTLRIIEASSPVQGQDLTLSIDARLTASIENTLTVHLKGTGLTRASVVAMNPKTGEVLALVSVPAYDANDFAQEIDTETYQTLVNDPDHPLFPRAYAGEYPTGSTIKPTYASAGLMEKIITPTTTFLSTGGVFLGGRLFPDWRTGGHGTTNVYHAIADSVNTFFYILGGGNEMFSGLGLDRLMQYARLFGYGSATGIDLPGEADGFLPSKTWKAETIGEPWYIGDTYNTAIGQGYFLGTPLQVARATAVFANEGKIVRPHILQNLMTVDETIMPADVLTIVREGMRETVTLGTARSLSTLPVAVAGKTGTAQWSNTKAPHSWFTGFAPYDEAEIVVTVMVEEGGDLNIATPIARDVLAWYFENKERVTD